MVTIINMFTAKECGPSVGFDDFYSAYPRKCAKVEALKAFQQQLVMGISPSIILEGSLRFAYMCRSKGTERDFIPYPASWLRGQRWYDEELLEYIPPTPEQIAEARDKADKLMKRGRYTPKIG